MNISATIWVLEDDPGCIFVYGKILKNYSTCVFSSISEFAQNLAKQKQPQLLIADLKLGDGSFLDYLSSTQKLTFPFLVVSSIDNPDTTRTCLQGGALDYVLKPFQQNELIAKIEKALI